MPKKKKRIGLALGGGGAKGLSHISFLEAFDELGVKPAVISGTSIGALIGALYASGMEARRIASFFMSLGILELGRLLDLSWKRRGGLIRGDKIMALFRETLKKSRFEDLAIPFKVVATDFWKRSEVVISDGDLVEAVRASISIPGIFEPASRKGRVLIDGGVINPLPWDVIREESDLLIAVDVSGEKTAQGGDDQADQAPDVFEVLLSTLQIMEAAIVEHKLRISRPDFYLKPKLENVKVLEFYRVREILEGVDQEKAALKAYLVQNLQ